MIFSDQEISAWTPKERLTVSQWAEKYRVLRAQAEEKGPLRMIRTPYLVPILNMANRLDPSPECNPDNVSFDHVKEVCFCKPAQIAGTEGVLTVAGYGTHQEGKSVLVSLADEDTMKYMALNRIQTMFTDSPLLSEFPVSKHWNIDEMALKNGGIIYAAWASSVAKTASKPIDIIVADEIDKPGYYATSKEASSLSLLNERNKARTNGMFWKLSTPTVEGGNMQTELESCDIIYDFHVPCPKCGVFQPLRWSMKYAEEFKDGFYRDRYGKMRQVGFVSWHGGREATRAEILAARYQCGSCDAQWTTEEKNNAVTKGMMVPRKKITEAPVSVGFHINRLYSLLGTAGDLSELVSDWCKIHKITDHVQKKKAKQGFINSTLAYFWKEVLVKPEIDEILKSRCDLEPDTVPPEAVALTCGIDMQKHGFYWVIRAWARDYTSWNIKYGYLETWTDIEDLLFKTSFEVVQNGMRHRIWRAALDTGGGKSGYEDFTMTEQAYFWLRKNAVGRGARVFGTKGSSKPMPGKIKIGKPFDTTPSGKLLQGGLQIIFLDTDQLKDMYHYRLGQARDGGDQAAYLHRLTGNDYAMHILAEEKRTDEKGLATWVQVKRDNHWLDAETLAMVCAEPEWPGGGVHMLRVNRPGPPPKDVSKTEKNSKAGFIPQNKGWFD